MSRKLTEEYIENFVKENSKCELVEIIRKKNRGLFLKLKCGEDGCYDWSMFFRCEVIGTEFENKDLLEE